MILTLKNGDFQKLAGICIDAWRKHKEHSERYEAWHGIGWLKALWEPKAKK
jgi:hypothetical protein